MKRPSADHGASALYRTMRAFIAPLPPRFERVAPPRDLWTCALPRRALCRLLVASALLPAQPAVAEEGFLRLDGGVEARDYHVGAGREATARSVVFVRWTGRLSARYGWPVQKEGAECELALGTGRVIRGVEVGLVGMREGGKRRLLIPADMGYRDEKGEPLPEDYGDRRRLFSTVLNKRRVTSAGDLLIDVQLLKVRERRSN